MGRRFQTYYIYNGKQGIKKTAFHIQVCCGDDTICLLEQVLNFIDKHSELMKGYNFLVNSKYDFNNICEFNMENNIDKMCEISRSDSLLKSINNVIYRTGVFLNARKIRYDLYDNPLRIDNNDGIFVVDLRKGKPRYCLMNYKFEIVTPEEYFDLYKDEYTEEEEILKEIPNITNNIKKFEEITIDEMRDLFPNMYLEKDLYKLKS